MYSEKIIQEFVNKLIKEKEGKCLDFKQKITSKSKIAKTISALANTEGGYLVIGISDQKKIIGIDPDEEAFMIESANEEYCTPKASIYMEEVKFLDKVESENPVLIEKTILLVKIEKSILEKIYCKQPNGELKAFHRVNDKTLAF